MRSLIFFVGTAYAAMMRVTLPRNVYIASTPDTEQQVTLQIGLKLKNIDQLEGKLKAVSDPTSPDYGKYLDADEVNEIFKPTEDSRDAVRNWLKKTGITNIADFGTHINFATTIGTADKLLGSSFQYFMVDNVQKLRTLQYSVPDELEKHIDLVSPTTFFGKTKAHAVIPAPEMLKGLLTSRQTANKTLNCAMLIEPGCLEQMYNYGGYTLDSSSKSRVGFGSFLNQSARQQDLTKYQQGYGLPLKNFSVTLINGGEDHQDPRGDISEANLDSQFMSAVTQTLPMTQFITGGSPPFVPNLQIPDKAHNTNEPYLDYYHYLMNVTNEDLPQVISNSYGDDEQTVPLEYATRVCNLIGMMGLRGITVLESSGDAGVGAPCQSNDGNATAEFTPQFPATCPYITGVGGTQAYKPEIAWVGSGGGFSNYFARPWYQKDAVNTYLDQYISNKTKAYYQPYTNFSGRGFPDISAHSASPPYYFIESGAGGYTGGTSAASPVVAGIIALLNDVRLKAGQPTMGFINPWLYSTGVKGLTDVTSGKATGCTGVNFQTGGTVEGGSVIPYASWNGTIGWDPVTGLGIPNFGELMKLAVVAGTA